MVAALSMAATEIAIPSLTEFAHSLADSHSPLTRAPALAPSFADCNDIARVLNRSARAFRAGHEGEVSHSEGRRMAADNLYICERALRQVKEELPVGFRRRLPHVEQKARRACS